MSMILTREYRTLNTIRHSTTLFSPALAVCVYGTREMILFFTFLYANADPCRRCRRRRKHFESCSGTNIIHLALVVRSAKASSSFVLLSARFDVRSTGTNTPHSWRVLSVSGRFGGVMSAEEDHAGSWLQQCAHCIRQSV